MKKFIILFIIINLLIISSLFSINMKELEKKAEHYCIISADTKEGDILMNKYIEYLKKAGKPAVKVFIRLAKKYKNDRLHYRRGRAILALGYVGDKSAVDFIIEYIEDEDRIRSAAMRSLGRIGGEKAKNILIKVAKKDYNKYSTEQENAILGLGNIGDEDVLPLLEEIIKKHKIKTIKKAAKKAIDKIKERIKMINIDKK